MPKELFNTIRNTKRTGSGKYTTVSVPKELNDQAEIICKNLQSSKMRFVELAMKKLIYEFNDTYGSFTWIDGQPHLNRAEDND